MGGAIVGLVVVLGFVLYWFLQILLIPFLLVALKCVEGDKTKYSKEEAEAFLERHRGQDLNLPSVDRLADALKRPRWTHVLVGVDLKHKEFIFEHDSRVAFDDVFPYN